ncbi:hypothetical protein DLM85_08210 [Hymenobacter edaphi]|uniref:Uncharacterized protein n=1 Tax=Hymenobacter edaphi TaxID=2211146 RepID=A0A328BPV6_9BACT|nr:hypothetical protein DLM85_08210 [Hymenobacter edaphi]
MASCQTTKSALTTPQWQFTAVDATDSTEAVVLMHSSQGPEPTRVVLPATEARALLAERTEAER